MRLTLRTLLAFMDDILDPTDHEDLSKKIEASDFATELIHRSRDTVRRLRLGAPAVLAEDGEDVLGSDSTADANTVAEYLDNTLSPESVVEFERICLEPGVEADIHLAEVASCHHVLTMVLGEPAELDEAVRQRMYELPEKLASGKLLRIEPGHQQPVQRSEPLPVEPASVVAPSSAARRVDRGESDLPDYLRAASRARKTRVRWIAAVVLLAMFGAVGAFVLTPVADQEPPANVAMGETGEFNDELVIEGITVDAPTDSTVPSAGDLSSAPVFNPEVADTENRDNAETPVGFATEIDSPVAGAEQSEVPPLVDSADERASLDTRPPTLDLSAIGSDLDPADIDSPPEVIEEETPSLAKRDEGADDAAIEQPEPTVPEGPIQLGNYSGNNDVLLRFDAASEKWIRLPPRSSIFTGDRLLALPKFRPLVALDDVNVYLSGGTKLECTQPDEFSQTNSLALNLVYGRLLVNAGINGSRLSLQVGDEQRTIQLGGSASLAVEAHRVFVPGKNFELETAPIEVSWYLTSGNLEWSGPTGESQSISAPSTWQTSAGVDELPQPNGDLPEWIDRESITDLERRARNTLAEELPEGEAAGIRLLELNDPRDRGRKREVRTLAAESSVFVGEFEPFVKSLVDPDQARAWNSHIDSLREALALSPNIASRVREAFVNQRGEQAAADLMEMVRGYGPEEIGQTRDEISQGAMLKLLGWLDNDSLDYRVLAIYNLNQITGTSYLANYRPDADSARRKRALRKLWDRFESNELLPAGF